MFGFLRGLEVLCGDADSMLFMPHLVYIRRALVGRTGRIASHYEQVMRRKND